MRTNLVMYLLIGVWLIPALCMAQQEKKKKIAVLEFKAVGSELKTEDVSVLTGRFRSLLVQTGTYDVFEREKMDAVLKEQDFSMSDVCNTAQCAVQVGQMLGVELMVAGDIGKIGDTWTMDLRLINVSTAEITKSINQDYQGKIDGLLGEMRKVALGFAGKEVVDKTNVSTKEEFGDINITSTPAGAEIFIDQKKMNMLTPTLIEHFPAGKHIIELRKGNHMAQKEIDLRDRAIENVKLELKLITIPVKFVSEPPDAQVWVDGVKELRTPGVLDLAIGKHDIKITKEDCESYTQELILKEGTISQGVNAVLKKLFNVSVFSKPDKCNVFLDNELIGQTPLEYKVTEGRHVIRIASENKKYEDYSEAFNFTSNKIIRQELSTASQRVAKEKEQQKLALKQKEEEAKKQQALEEDMQKKADQARKAAQSITTSKNTKSGRKTWLCVTGAVRAAGGAAAVLLLGGKKGGGGSSGIGTPGWPSGD